MTEQRSSAELVAASPAAAAGVPTDLIERIDAAIQRIVNGQACMRIPAESTDPDLVLAECKRILKAASPVAPVGAPTRQHSVHLAADDAEQDFHDGPALSTAARDVLTERERQKSVEGWTPEHDDEHDGGQMANAAAAYAMEAANQVGGMMPAAPNDIAPSWWPWDEAWWKPKDARRNLVRAGALILAEIERMDRALLSRPGCELATDATKQQMFNGLTQEETDATASVMGLVHLAATPIDQDFRMRPASSEAAPSAERPAQVAAQLRDLARRQSERGNHSLAETLGEAANLLSPQGKWFISETLACRRADGCTSPADCSSTDACKV